MSDEFNDPEEIMMRQIHPKCMVDGEPSSDRFRPSDKDNNKMSVDRESLTTAANSHSLYVNNGLESAAVFGLSIAELSNESITCIADPIDGECGRQPNPAHALADYSFHSCKTQKLVAKRLKRLAILRGLLHPK